MNRLEPKISVRAIIRRWNRRTVDLLLRLAFAFVWARPEGGREAEAVVRRQIRRVELFRELRAMFGREGQTDRLTEVLLVFMGSHTTIVLFTKSRPVLIARTKMT